jgi:hypothetical protein
MTSMARMALREELAEAGEVTQASKALEVGVVTRLISALRRQMRSLRTSLVVGILLLTSLTGVAWDRRSRKVEVQDVIHFPTFSTMMMTTSSEAA